MLHLEFISDHCLTLNLWKCLAIPLYLRQCCSYPVAYGVVSATCHLSIPVGLFNKNYHSVLSDSYMDFTLVLTATCFTDLLSLLILDFLLKVNLLNLRFGAREKHDFQIVFYQWNDLLLSVLFAITFSRFNPDSHLSNLNLFRERWLFLVNFLLTSSQERFSQSDKLYFSFDISVVCWFRDFLNFRIIQCSIWVHILPP